MALIDESADRSHLDTEAPNAPVAMRVRRRPAPASYAGDAYDAHPDWRCPNAMSYC